MKIRIKFTKTGPIRFVGHLDFMRSFQKTLKKSGLRAVYTAGFNPHMILSFAAPLGVGEESVGEYADVDFAYRDDGELSDQEKDRMKDLGLDNAELPPPPSAAELIAAFNGAAPEGVRAVSARRIGLIKGSKAMALVRYAAFLLVLRDGFLDAVPLAETAERFLAREEIILHKKTKKSEKDVNIRPMIREISAVDDAGAAAGGKAVPDADAAGKTEFDAGAGAATAGKAVPDADAAEFDADAAAGTAAIGDLMPAFASGRRALRLVCAQGSSENLKPAAVMEAFCAFAKAEYDPYGFRVVRLDLCDGTMRPLSELGEDF